VRGAPLSLIIASAAAARDAYMRGSVFCVWARRALANTALMSLFIHSSGVKNVTSARACAPAVTLAPRRNDRSNTCALSSSACINSLRAGAAHRNSRLLPLVVFISLRHRGARDALEHASS